MNPRLSDLLEAYPDTAVMFGDTAFVQLETLFLETRPQRVLLCTGRGSIKAHRGLELFCRALESLSAAWEQFSDIEPEPTTDTVDRIASVMRLFEPDLVVAMGGGSIMDAAKAAYLLYQNGGSLDDYFGVNRWSTAHPGQKLRKVICIPTTAGTGSEATPYANIVDRAKNVKKLIVETEIIPEFSFVYPELTLSAPADVVRATGCDALAHLLEGFLNVGQDDRHPDANTWARTGIRLIVDHLPNRLAQPDNAEAATALAAAATLGGMVIRYKSTGLPHLCSFSWFGKIEHGLAVAMLLPAAWSYYLGNPAVAERTMQLRDIFPGDTPEAVITSYRAFLDRCGVAGSLREIPGITPELLAQTAAGAAENKMKLELAPRPVPLDRSREILAGILNQAWEGVIRPS